MKTTTRTIKAILFGFIIIMLFGSPMSGTESCNNANQTFLRRNYSMMYLEHCRQKYQIIYNDDNKNLDDMVVRK